MSKNLSQINYCLALGLIFVLLILLAKNSSNFYFLALFVTSPLLGAIVTFRLITLRLETSWSIGIGTISSFAFLILMTSYSELTDTGRSFLFLLNTFIVYLAIRNKNF